MPTATAEILSIGDEMTSGSRLDTNSQWLSQRLGELGVEVRFHSTVGDQLADNIDAFRIATARADLVISTGGLGPTADDLTRDALAALTAQPLVASPAALAHIEAIFRRSGRPMPPRNRVQALFPAGAEQIFNPRGTAPGIDLRVPRPAAASPAGSSDASLQSARTARVFALPGVPAEMMEMFTQTVAPRINEQFGEQRRAIRHAVIKCFGIGESDMEARLGEMIARTHWPRVGITVSAATISLRISAEAASEPECLEMIAQTRREIMEKAGQYVFGEGEDFELQHALAEVLAARRQRLATLEIGHAALLANWLVDVAPDGVYAGGTVASALSQANDAAETCLRASSADWVLVVDHYPSLRSGQDLVAELTITLRGRTPHQHWQHHCRLGGHPAILHARIGKTALAFARATLQAELANESGR